MNEPTLSICVPSRNRQVYFQSLVAALQASPRSDVEFVLVDNSDDPSVMDDFMAPRLADPRIRYVRSAPTVRSMMDNWETAVSAATGRWITCIGDDDYCDPDAAHVIGLIEAREPNVDAIDWAKLFYTWPNGATPPENQAIALDTEIHPVEKALLVERAYQWRDASHVLASGFSIYHGAVSRRLFETIRTRYGGRFFEYPIVDYEALYKIILHGERFVHCRRPLSVLGVCPEANSAAIRDPEAMKRRIDTFNAETGAPIDEMDCYRDYPFKSTLGVIAAVGMVHHWIIGRAGLSVKGFEENFARAAAAQCSIIPDRPEYDAVTAAWRSAFKRWKGGRHLSAFRPEFKGVKEGVPYRGVWQQSLYLDVDNPWCRSAADYYRFVGDMLVTVGALEADLGRYRALSHRDERALARA